MSSLSCRVAGRILAFLALAGLLSLAVPRHAPANPVDSTDFDAGTAAFAVQVGDTEITHRLMAVTVLPDSTVRIGAASGIHRAEYRLAASLPLSYRRAGSSWTLTAPSALGLYPVVITNTTSGASVRLQVFVLNPWDHEGRRLNGYRIGRYEQEPRRDRAVYEPPEGFVKVTTENQNVLVSPNFRLDQFLCKQTEDTPSMHSSVLACSATSNRCSPP